MTELIAGISGFIFRHEVTAAAAPPPQQPDSHTSTETTRLCRYSSRHSALTCVRVCVFLDQGDVSHDVQRSSDEVRRAGREESGRG